MKLYRISLPAIGQTNLLNVLFPAVVSLVCGQLKAADFASARQFLQTYCVSCHGEKKPKGDFDIRPLIESNDLKEHLPRWLDVLDQLDSAQMPPRKNLKAKRPQAIEYRELATWLKPAIQVASRSGGRLTRRLNRAEYNNTIRDLLLIDPRPADRFPQDLGRQGFDNVAEAQSVSLLLLEKYLRAARESLSQAIVTGPEPAQINVRYFPLGSSQKSGKSPIKPSSIALETLARKERREQEKGPVQFLRLDWSSGSRDGDGNVREGKGAHGYEVRLEHTGNSSRRGSFQFNNLLPGASYRLTVRCYAEQARDRRSEQFIEPTGSCLMGIFVNGERIHTQPVGITKKPGIFEFNFTTQRTKTEVAMAASSSVNEKDRPGIPNLVVCEAAISGPLYDSWPPASHRAIFGDEGKKSLREIFSRFITRAFRRPSTDEEISLYISIAESGMEDGLGQEEAVALALQAALASPNFLYMVEGTRPGGALSGYEVASRLSYFLWSSMPDKELFQLAAAGRLGNTAILREQVKRMLEDPKAEALVENFAAQWIGFRRMNDIAPDPTVFRKWDEDLRSAMRAEPEHFFRNVLRENLELGSFLDSEFTFVNERLARHYGIDGVVGGEFRKVKLDPATHRGGLVTQAGVLTLASQPTRSSPVFRGKFVIDKLFNRPPPNPPADVPPLTDEPELSKPGNLREQLARHVRDPACAGCHSKIDPWGIALENFDGIGTWRDLPEDDLATVLPDGTRFSGPEGLKKILMGRRDQFLRGLAEKLFLYALGRTLTLDDFDQVDLLVEQTRREGGTFRALATFIVLSESFRKR